MEDAKLIYGIFAAFNGTPIYGCRQGFISLDSRYVNFLNFTDVLGHLSATTPFFFISR
jgi:hypothetical protein